MPQQVISFGTDDKGTGGDTVPSALTKCNSNFTELYNKFTTLPASWASATKLATARTITMTGDGSWSTSFDGSGNVTAALTLANTAVTAGGYGSNTEIATFSVDAKGRITAAAKIAIRAATTSVSGIVQLSSATNSTSAALAATPAAVKAAYDLANAAVPGAQKGAVNGVATLDAKGKVPLSQLELPISGQYLGTQAVKAISYNAQVITENVVIPADVNAMSAGPITIADGKTVTVSDGATWTVV